MPKMTGVEVLSKVRALSPRTVRILLTGYADLDAVEGSINESEVFRFLTKPCAPNSCARRSSSPRSSRAKRRRPHAPSRCRRRTRSRSSWKATRSRRSASMHRAIRRRGRSLNERIVAHGRASSSRSSRPRAAPRRARRPARRSSRRVSASSCSRATTKSSTTVQKAVRGRLPVYTAGNIVQVVKILDRASARRARDRRLRRQGDDPVDDGAAQGARAAARDDRRLAASRRARHGVAHQSRPDLPLPAQAALGGAVRRSACRRRYSITACC